MLISAVFAHIQSILMNVPVTHWLVIGTLTLALIVILLTWKKCSIYGAICLGIVFFVCVFLLDATVVNRYIGTLPQETGLDLSLRRLFHSTEQGRIELCSNIIAFFPFGLLFSEFLTTTKIIVTWRRMSCAALVAFVLSGRSGASY